MKALHSVMILKRRGETLLKWLLGLVTVLLLIIILLRGLSGVKIGVFPDEANLQVNDIAAAIEAYKQTYGRYPVSTNIETMALTGKNDFTCGGPQLDSILGPGIHTPLNADIIAVLMDMTNFPDGRPTVNSNNCLNPQRTMFLNARFSGNNSGPGVGMDGIYRDPWGHPYIISMDLNGDHRCRDAFYKNCLVSKKSDADGFNSLKNFSNPNGDSDQFEFEGDVMVWSLGPDGTADVTKTSKSAPNSDNVLSWQ